MVRESVVARPRREAAVQGVKAVTGTLTRRSSAGEKAATAQKARNSTTTRTQARRSTASSARNEDTSSDEDEDEEDESDSAEEVESEDDNVNDEESEASELSEPEYDMDDSGTFGASTSKRKAAPKRGPAAKKAKGTARQAKAGRGGAKAKAKTSKKAATAHAQGKAIARRMANKEALPINEDNKLFNCIKNNTEDLKTVANDWMAYYLDNAPAALAQFINCVLRSCGCNETVDEVQVVETEEAVTVLTEVQQHFKEQSMPSYPLVSRAPAFKHFRRNLGAFVKHCIVAANEADVLLDDQLIVTLIAWIGSMTSSSYRAFRHTATMYALFIMGQIGRVAQEKREPLGKLMKTRDAEKRKASAARARDLDQQVKELDGTVKELDAHFKDLFQTVFQHRFRDADATIRMECIEELGRWMASMPDQFLTSAYLLYPGWTLTDPDEQVRLATVQCLASLYARHGTRSSMQTFTARFVPRLLEMATSDINVSVRVATINMVSHVNKVGAVEEASRDSIAAHIFDVEPRVRAAVAKFIASFVEAEVEVDGEEEDEDEQTVWRRYKALAAVLVRLNDNLKASDASEEAIAGPSDQHTRSRNSIALEDLWTAYPAIREWESLLALLQLDHTGSDGETDNGAGRGRGGRRQKQVAPDLDDDTRLEPSEESILVEALPVFMEKAQKVTVGKQAAVQEAEKSEAKAQMTKDLMPILGQLFNKYRTESGRIQNMLRLPSLMELGLYLEYQELGSYEELWDQVLDQFNRHTEEGILAGAVDAIVALQETHAMSALNETKAQALREATTAAFGDAARAALREDSDEHADELEAAILRLGFLVRKVDLAAEIEDTDENHHASAWDYLLQVGQRATKADMTWEKIAIAAIRSMSLFIMWKVRSLMPLEDSDAKDLQVADVADKRHDLLALLSAVLDGQQASSNPELVREVYREVLDIHILFATMQAVGEAEQDAEVTSTPLPEKLRLVCEGSLQDKFASYVAEVIKRFEENEEDDAASHNASQVQPSMQAQVQTMRSIKRQYALVDAISHYIGAIRLGVIDLRQCIPLLSKYGLLGHLFDACLRVCVDAVREAGIFQKRAEYACRVILDSLKESLALAQHEQGQEDHFVGLSRLLSSCLVVRGAQLAVTVSMPAASVIGLHERGIAFALDKSKLAVESSDEEANENALTFFKALSNLLVGLGPRDALKLKLSLSEALKARSLHMPSTAEKEWDALRAYEKRLVTLASKSEAFAAAGQASSPVAAASSPNAADDGPSSPLAAATSSSRPRPRPRARAASSAANSVSEGNGEDDDVESVLGGRGGAHDDTLGDLTLRSAGVGMESALSARGLDITEDGNEDEGDEVEDADAADETAQSTSQRTSRTSRRRAPVDEASDDEDEALSQDKATARKRARRS